MSDHYSVDFERNDEGWWPGRCVCGADLGMFPDAEDACDALMDHAARIVATLPAVAPGDAEATT